MDESYIEGRFGIVMEEIRDALMGIRFELEELNEKLSNLNACIETRTQLNALRVADITRKP